MKNRSGKGFTLIELMIVVAILGVIASIFVPLIVYWDEKVKQREATSYLTAVERYWNEKGNLESFPVEKHPLQYYTAKFTGDEVRLEGNIDDDATRDVWLWMTANKHFTHVTNDVVE